MYHSSTITTGTFCGRRNWIGGGGGSEYGGFSIEDPDMMTVPASNAVPIRGGRGLNVGPLNAVGSNALAAGMYISVSTFI